MARPSDTSANKLKELRRNGQTQEWPEIGQIGSKKESAMINSSEAKSLKESSWKKESCTSQIPLLPPISPTSQRNYSPTPGDKVQVTVELCLRILEWREQIKQPSPQKAHRDYVLFGIPPPRQRQPEPPWIPSARLSQTDPFLPFKIKREEDDVFTAVSSAAKYKNWIRTKEGQEGYCYLKFYQRRYQPYAFMLYGRHPELRQLNLSANYLSHIFDELNIAVNYETNMFHVYSQINVTYPPGFEKIKRNKGMVDNPWHETFLVGATAAVTAGGSISRAPRSHRRQVITDDRSNESEDDSETRIQTHKARERSMARYRNRQKHIHNLMSGMPGREASETEQLQDKITALRADRNHWRRTARENQKGKERERSPGGISTHEEEAEGNNHGNGGSGSGSHSGSGSSDEETTSSIRRRHPFRKGKGPKIALPTIFDGDRDFVKAFKRDCQLYIMARPDEFRSERAKISWVLSFIKGKDVDDWANWVFGLIEAKDVYAPKTLKELYKQLENYFGDPHQASTAQIKMDQL